MGRWMDGMTQMEEWMDRMTDKWRDGINDDGRKEEWMGRMTDRWSDRWVSRWME